MRRFNIHGGTSRSPSLIPAVSCCNRLTGREQDGANQYSAEQEELRRTHNGSFAEPQRTCFAAGGTPRDPDVGPAAPTASNGSKPNGQCGRWVNAAITPCATRCTKHPAIRFPVAAAIAPAYVRICPA